MFEQKNQEIFTGCSDLLSQSIGRGRISREGAEPLMFARVENSVTNRAKIFAGKIVKTQFWPDFFHFSQQDRFLFARVEIGVTEFPTKTTEQEQGKNVWDIFQKWVRIP